MLKSESLELSFHCIQFLVTLHESLFNTEDFKCSQKGAMNVHLLLPTPQKCHVWVLSHVQLFATPMDCRPPGSSVHGISQARVLEWVVIPFFRGSSQPQDQTHVSWIGRQILYHWATWEAHKLGRYHFNQMIRFSISRKGQPQDRTQWEHSIASMLFLPKLH